jgi:hypothetical protein
MKSDREAKELTEFVQGQRQSVAVSGDVAKAITPMGLIIEPGTPIEIVIDSNDLKATNPKGSVTQVLIRANFCVEYQVRWWNGNSLEEAWLPTNMIRPLEFGNGYRSIGFQQAPGGDLPRETNR